MNWFSVKENKMDLNNLYKRRIDKVLIKEWEPLFEEGKAIKKWGENKDKGFYEIPLSERGFKNLGPIKNFEVNYKSEYKKLNFDNTLEAVYIRGEEELEVSFQLGLESERLLSTLSLGAKEKEVPYETLSFQKPLKEQEEYTINKDELKLLHLKEGAKMSALEALYNESKKNASEDYIFTELNKNTLKLKLKKEAELFKKELKSKKGLSRGGIFEYSKPVTLVELYEERGKLRYREFYKGYIDLSLQEKITSASGSDEGRAVKINFTADITRESGDQIFMEINDFEAC